MLTAAQCQAFAQQYKGMSLVPDISKDRAFLLKNIARSFAGLASQLDMLAAKVRDEQG